MTRKSRTIEWVSGSRPVICAVKERGVALVCDKAANRTQLTKTLAEGGMIAGVLAPLASHNLRYGAARDAANIPGSLNGLPTEAVAITLGHSISAYQAGVTKQYVGSQTDTWTMRVESYYEDPFGTNVDEAIVTTRPQKRKFGEDEITQLCQDQGLDVTCKKARAKAAYTERRRTNSIWMKDANEKFREATADLPIVSENIENDTVTPASNDEAYDEPQLAFIKRFSTINIANNQSVMRPDGVSKLAEMAGNSRDSPEFFENITTGFPESV
ncbi:hypothetical protein VE03_04361 [Pseudogymnoascus sp. 23342-1-I1]|nr:hypothetical protein VE03_04361 [Pseudogymnoascus sp. 23342-1-I1]